jgi:alpha-beta hydrolase superfamily lysophospholipase
MRILYCLLGGISLVLTPALYAGKPYPRSIPLPPGCPEPALTREKVASRDGTPLTVYEWAPPKAAAGKPVVLFLHGIGMHGDLYGAIAAGFTCHGLTFVAPDLRGHGRSGGVRGELAEAHVLRADVGAVIDRIRERHPKSPIVLLGDSMGGILAADYAWRGEKPLAGLVLMVPAFSVHASRLQGATSGVARLLTGGRVAIGTRESLESCTRDKAFLEARLADKLALNEVELSFLTRLLRMQTDVVAAAGAIKVPLYVTVAGKDRVIDNAVVERFYAAAGTPKDAKTWRRWEGAHHTLCWDPVTRQAIDDIARWVLKQR